MNYKDEISLMPSFQKWMIFLFAAFFSVHGIADPKVKKSSPKAVSSSVPQSIPVPAVEEFAELSALPESKVRLDGDSTLRKYSSTANRNMFKLKVKKGTPFTEQVPWFPQELELIIPVSEMKSGDSTLDEHMLNALKSDQYKEIRVHLNQFVSQGKDIDANGQITVAGVTRPIALKGAFIVENGQVKAVGKKKLLMSEFGIKPPTLFLGTITVEDEITISYDVGFVL